MVNSKQQQSRTDCHQFIKYIRLQFIKSVNSINFCELFAEKEKINKKIACHYSSVEKAHVHVHFTPLSLLPHCD
eukprot:m.198989 g.198989  ORF g.198989 m.198989 type:complete len:74 (-) comp13692_c2_seq1:266-487(-)